MQPWGLISKMIRVILTKILQVKHQQEQEMQALTTITIKVMKETISTLTTICVLRPLCQVLVTLQDQQ